MICGILSFRESSIESLGADTERLVGWATGNANSASNIGLRSSKPGPDRVLNESFGETTHYYRGTHPALSCMSSWETNMGMIQTLFLGNVVAAETQHSNVQA